VLHVMTRKLSRGLAAAALAAAVTAVAEAPASSASADPGHCWRQGAGPVAATPGWVYQITNICRATISVRVVLHSNGRKSECKDVSGRGYRWYYMSYYSSYFWAENC
jgi:hypothetical protein